MRYTLFRSSLLGLVFLVAEVEADIGRNHDKIGEIEPESQIKGLGEELGAKAADIAEENEKHKGQALSLGRLGADRLNDGEGPGYAEADDHQGFQNAS